MDTNSFQAWAAANIAVATHMIHMGLLKDVQLGVMYEREVLFVFEANLQHLATLTESKLDFSLIAHFFQSLRQMKQESLCNHQRFVLRQSQ